MKKRLVLTVLCAAITASALASCGNAGSSPATAGPSQSSTQEAAQEENTAETAAPEIEEVDMSPITDADPADYIDLPDIEQMQITVAPKKEVTEEDIENAYSTYKENAVVLTEVEGRDVVQKGDVVNIDYTEKEKTGNDYSGKDYNVEIGAGTMISTEFEENMVGMKKGETKTFDFTYPDDFTEESLRGTASSFTITVNKIQSYSTAELSNETITSFGLYMEDGSAVTTEEELREYIRQSVETNNEQSYTYNKQSEAIVALTEAAVIKKEPTKEMTDAAMSYMMAGIGMREEDLDENAHSAFLEYAKDFVIEQLCIEKICSDQGLAVTEDEIRTELEKIYGADAEERLRKMSATDRYSFTAMVKREKAADYILSKAQITEKEPDSSVQEDSQAEEEVINTLEGAEKENTEAGEP